MNLQTSSLYLVDSLPSLPLDNIASNILYDFFCNVLSKALFYEYIKKIKIVALILKNMYSGGTLNFLL